MKPIRPRRLHPDEEHLWRRVAESVAPLHPPRCHPCTPAAARPEGPPPEPLPAPGLPPDFAIGAHASGEGRSRNVTSPTASAPRMDGRAFLRMARGKLAPEARIDLHGMTLADARPALSGFILRGHSAGKRLVLVITGKGRGGPGDGPIPERPGILKRAVPQWLSAPPLSLLVLEVAEAHRRHGGSGAYYVYLRRSREQRSRP